jgi:hypothetical protein
MSMREMRGCGAKAARVAPRATDAEESVDKLSARCAAIMLESRRDIPYREMFRRLGIRDDLRRWTNVSQSSFAAREAHGGSRRMVVSSRGRVRLVGVAAACGVSVFAGLGLVFKLVTPESIPHLRTPELLGLLALLVMPMLVLAAVRSHRSSEGHGAAMAGNEPPQRAGEAIQAIVVLAADVRDKSGDRHRRRAVVHGRGRVKA